MSGDLRKDEIERLRRHASDVDDPYRPTQSDLAFMIDSYDLLNLELGRKDGALRDAEWHGAAWIGMECCPVCGGEREEGHKPDCSLAAALASVSPQAGTRSALADDVVLSAAPNERELFEALLGEMHRQDFKHGPFQGSRIGRSRLALACLEDEVREALQAWRDERQADGWEESRLEVLQVAAVAMRALRDALTNGDHAERGASNLVDGGQS